MPWLSRSAFAAWRLGRSPCWASRARCPFSAPRLHSTLCRSRDGCFCWALVSGVSGDGLVFSEGFGCCAMTDVDSDSMLSTMEAMINSFRFMVVSPLGRSFPVIVSASWVVSPLGPNLSRYSDFFGTKACLTNCDLLLV